MTQDSRCQTQDIETQTPERTGYKKLLVWQKADDLAFKVYIETKSFPKDEVYALTSQLRRAALSVPTNIVEGNSRHHKTELRQFLSIALGSLAETEYLIDFSLKLGYLTIDNHSNLQNLRQEVGKLLWRFYKSI